MHDEVLEYACNATSCTLIACINGFEFQEFTLLTIDFCMAFNKNKNLTALRTKRKQSSYINLMQLITLPSEFFLAQDL